MEGKDWRTDSGKKKLKELFTEFVDDEILSDADVMMVLQICSDACERMKAEIVEDVLIRKLHGGDAGC